MRKSLIFIGVLLILGAAGMFAYRQLYAPMTGAAYQNSDEAGGAKKRGFEPNAYSRPAERRAARAERNGRGTGSLRMAELLINVLNTIVGIVGIALWVSGSRMQRQAQSQSQSMTASGGPN